MAITTMFDGIEYRSRLEARWAAFFTNIGWQTTYEPFDGDGYIPDFLVHGERPLLVEIKPAVSLVDFQSPIEKVTRGLAAHWTGDILIVGADPLPDLHSKAWANQFPVAGLLGEYGYGKDQDEWWFENALWSDCEKCHKPAVWHDYGLYATRPCHRDSRGDHSGWLSTSRVVKDAWATACNEVKWRGRAA
jgi:hypothetical protein